LHLIRVVCFLPYSKIDHFL
uniref:Uncharacterized protein n=1 Tax=Amphimedon queenslandica TaxID=400682 RepID=A0A1X7VG89_AMPQE